MLNPVMLGVTYPARIVCKTPNCAMIDDVKSAGKNMPTRWASMHEMDWLNVNRLCAMLTFNQHVISHQSSVIGSLT